jgi:hypothetical protein
MRALRWLMGLSLSVRVIRDQVLGIASGLFFGERIAPVQPLGSVFIGLLQMTVIPYIVVSLIAAIGRLTMDQIRMLAARGGGLRSISTSPLALALPRGDQLFKAYIDNWLMLQEQNGRLTELYEYWVLGKSIAAGGERWSVIRDVLGRVD